MSIVRAGSERMQGFLDHLRKLASGGSEREVELTRRGVLGELALNIEWVEEHAAALVELWPAAR